MGLRVGHIAVGAYNTVADRVDYCTGT
ncbi:unnamed protein product [Chondrus crispus]|uniref:Uncharacterized protein n=1 Tax=Chondrus crispus TaxID=2769 RepID=S0F2W0_CHOCR|nr:unnamed protein product [Chondrus crispus]CDF77450.1 unnamed protein product [Chondrus crispus]|eukprot:XP_005712324.1 unnamed protein product [Chondrus crispus]